MKRDSLLVTSSGEKALSEESRQQRRFTPTELKRFDGKEGRPCYTAYNGKVYDVSASNMWLSGRHLERHSAGEDLTERMINAPHDEEVLTRFPVVGELVLEHFHSRFVLTLQKMHLHPMVVHFSEACPMLAALFVFIFYFGARITVFEMTSYYMIVLAFFSSLACMATGFFSWIVGYERTLTPVFSRKILLSILLTILITVLYVWRTLDRGALTHMDALTPIYAGLVFLTVPNVILLGHYGGRIVYG